MAMKKSDFDAILKRYLTRKASKNEEKLVEEWFNKLPANNELNLESEEQRVLRHLLWKGIEHHAKILKPARSIRWTRVAASLLIIVFFSLIFNVSDLIHENRVYLPEQNKKTEINTIANTYRADYSVCLPDGTSIVLRPGSIIQYPNVFGKERLIVLKGNAFFDVARDTKHPFVVQTGNVTTRVLGTSFWVEENRKKRTVEVSVKSGKVMVYKTEEGNTGLDRLILKPNQKGVYYRKSETLVKTLVDEPIIVDESVLLKLRYENTAVTEILDTLERIYGIQIDYNAQDLGGCTLTTELTEENLFERIQIICDALGLEYSVGNEAIEVKGRCK